MHSAAKSEGRDRFAISMAMSVGHTLNKLLEDKSNSMAFFNAIDQINVMAYDIHGKWDRSTGYVMH